MELFAAPVDPIVAWRAREHWAGTEIDWSDWCLQMFWFWFARENRQNVIRM
jgi:hypothetical protein